MFNFFKKDKSAPESGQQHNLDKYSFIMKIDDTFPLIKSGIVVVGQISKGTIYNKSNILILDENGTVIKETSVAAMEIPPDSIEMATKGQHIGMMINDVSKEDIHPGNYIVMQ